MPRTRFTAHLYSDGGGWGLPTIDADGLSAHALLRFSSIDYASTTGTSRSMTESQASPVLVVTSIKEDDAAGESAVAAGLPAVLGLLCSNKSLGDADADLTPFMAAESAAFAALVREKIEPLRMHELYRDDANYADVFPVLVAAGSSWPISRVAPYMRRRSVLALLAGRDVDALERDAKAGIDALATRLGDRNKYFYGDTPTTLDAIVFGQLAVALTVPLTRARLRALVASHANLLAFVERICAAHFDDDDEGRTDIQEAAAAARDDAKRRAAQQSSRRAAEERRNKRGGDSESAEDRDRRVGNAYFVWGSVAVFAAHLLLSNEIEFSMD